MLPLGYAMKRSQGKFRVLTKVESVVAVEPVGEFALKGIRRRLAAYNVLAAASSKI